MNASSRPGTSLAPSVITNCNRQERNVSARIAMPQADLQVADYAPIGNCKTLALVSRLGSIDWLCLPHFSGESVFAALLDGERGGRFAITPRDIVDIEQAYIDDSNVLRTVFRCRGGTLELTDCMAIGAGTVAEQRELSPAHEILRTARCTEGEVEIEAIYQPRPGYAGALPGLARRGRLGWQCWLGRMHVHLLTDLALEPAGPATLGCVERLHQGERRDASFTNAENDISVIAPLGDALQRRIAASVDWWRDWCVRCRYDGPWRDAVLRSALGLKLLTYCLSGAVVAAGTTSLPVGSRGDRNWDYRYCWLRDTSLVLQSFIDLGYAEESEAFLSWLLHATRLTQPRLQVLYDVFGETSLRERELPQLRGHRGRGPVRVGNAASSQVQLDVYGEVLLTADEFVRRGGVLDRDEKGLLAGFADTAAALWRRPDQGIWEVRLPPRHNTYSKLMCWTALDRALRLHERIGLPVDAERLHAEREALHDDIERHGFDAGLQSYVGTYGSLAADASLLLMPRLGYLDANDPRMQGTMRHIEDQLGVDGLLYRYPPGPRYDGVRSDEGLFVICSFWRAECLARQGRIAEARSLFERLLSLRNPVGLFAEELDVPTLALRGNFPQAFSHVGLITAALALQEAGAKP